MAVTTDAVFSLLFTETLVDVIEVGETELNYSNKLLQEIPPEIGDATLLEVRKLINNILFLRNSSCIQICSPHYLHRLAYCKI